jgi:hypothetical protein
LKGCPDCARYEKEIKDLKEEFRRVTSALKEEIALLKFELEELKAKRYKPPKPPKDSPPKASRKKKGGLFGHSGWFTTDRQNRRCKIR